MLKIIYVLILCILVYLCFNKNLKYAKGLSTQQISTSAQKYNYLISTQKNKNLLIYLDINATTTFPPHTLFGTSTDTENNIVGGLLSIPWNNDFFVGNHLKVSKNHRLQGIANELIRQCVNRIVDDGSFGVFSSSVVIRAPNIETMFTIYWTKTKVSNNNYLNCNKLDWNNICYASYPRHSWFHSNIRKEFLKYLKNIKNHYIVSVKEKQLTIGIMFCIDKQNHKVCAVKWYWGNIDDVKEYLTSIAFTIEANYVALPTIYKPLKIWDLSISYCYNRPKHKTFPIFCDKDKIGWFLDR